MYSEFNYGPTHYRGLIGANGRLTSFCKGNSSTQSNPNNSQTVTDNRIAASDGGQVSSNGGSITNNNVSGDIIKANNDALMKFSGDVAHVSIAAVDSANRAASDSSYSSMESARAAAQAAADAAYSATQSNADVSKTALVENSDVAKAAISAGAYQTQGGYDFGRDIFHEAAGSLIYSNDNAASIAKAAIALADGSQKSANDLIRDTNTDFTQKLVANAGIADSTQKDNLTKYVTIAATVIALGIAYYGASKKA